MSSTAHLPLPPNLRWTSQTSNSGMILMDTSCVMPYNRPATSTSLQRPILPPQYVVTSFGEAGMPHMATAPCIPQMPLGNFGAYNTSQPSPTPPCVEQMSFQRRPSMSIISPESHNNGHQAFPKCTPEQISPIPAVKPERRFSTTLSPPMTSVPSPPMHIGPPEGKDRKSQTTRTLTAISNGKDQENLPNEVDKLVKVIQALPETDNILKMLESDPKFFQPGLHTEVPKSKRKERMFPCDFEGCDMMSPSKTHLEIHMRKHTGEKPYVCKHAGCTSRFSQAGNLKAHERRHTGERPYSCDICGKTFGQRGNVSAHKAVHRDDKAFTCRLDGCFKQFTQLGNLKVHMNRFHARTVSVLKYKLGNIRDWHSVPQTERPLLIYFATLYKHSNKGIKGRGKDRRVTPFVRNLKSLSKTDEAMVEPQDLAEQTHMHHLSPGITTYVGYNDGAPGHYRGGYDAIDKEEMCSSVSPASSLDSMYDDDRELAFGDRSY